MRACLVAIVAARAVARPRARRGQALVEFAFVVPLLLLFAFAFIDFGRAVFAYTTVSNAAREAARVAAVSQLDPVAGPWRCISNKPVEDVLDPNWTFRGCAMAAGATVGVTDADVTITYAAPPGTDLECSTELSVGCLAAVTVVSDFAPITPIAGQLIGSIAMSATSEMPIERLYP